MVAGCPLGYIEPQDPRLRCRADFICDVACIISHLTGGKFFGQCEGFLGLAAKPGLEFLPLASFGDQPEPELIRRSGGRSGARRRCPVEQRARRGPRKIAGSGSNTTDLLCETRKKRATMSRFLWRKNWTLATLAFAPGRFFRRVSTFLHRPQWHPRWLPAQRPRPSLAAISKIVRPSHQQGVHGVRAASAVRLACFCQARPGPGSVFTTRMCCRSTLHGEPNCNSAKI